MKEISIRKATINDLKQLKNIGEKTFKETFDADNSSKNMEEYIIKSFNSDQVKKELNNPESEFYFAEVITPTPTIIGYLKVNTGKAQTEIQDNASLEIERIYVLKKFQKLKVGQQLFEKALCIALEKKMYYIWLGVWEENEKAISFYKKNSFIEFDKHIFKLGDDEQTDIMMKKELIDTNDI